jgi:hypothetical protein
MSFYLVSEEEQILARLRNTFLQQHPEVKSKDLTINDFRDHGKSITIKYTISSRARFQRRGEENIDLSQGGIGKIIRGPFLG